MKISFAHSILYSTFAILIALCTFALLPPTMPLSPLGDSHESRFMNHDSSSYIVLGFAPYWNLKKLTTESSEHITHFAYFALHLDSDGEIYTHVNAREQEPGYTNYLRIIKGSLDVPNKPLILTYMPIDQDALKSILTNTSARSQAVKNMVQSVKESGAHGVNVDFEPVGEISATERNNYTLLIQELKNELDKLEDSQLLTISVYASSAVRPRIWDLAKLAPLTNYFVVMTYDYTLPSSKRSGPNAPLRDAGGDLEHNIVKNISEISKLVDSRKILLGIPLYGYQWETVDESKYAPSESRGVTASLERIEQMLEERTLSLLWDRNTLTPYGVASNAGEISQIYFENDVSLRLKLDFVKSAHLGGIALWALGYDGNVSWLWPTLNTLNN